MFDMAFDVTAMPPDCPQCAMAVQLRSDRSFEVFAPGNSDQKHLAP